MLMGLTRHSDGECKPYQLQLLKTWPLFTYLYLDYFLKSKQNSPFFFKHRLWGTTNKVLRWLSIVFNGNSRTIAVFFLNNIYMFRKDRFLDTCGRIRSNSSDIYDWAMCICCKKCRLPYLPQKYEPVHRGNWNLGMVRLLKHFLIMGGARFHLY